MATGLDNLKVYQLAADLEVAVHKIIRQFPPDERYASIQQLRRSSSSVPNNIAEAYNKRSPKEKIRILNDIAKGEAEETKRNLLQCARMEFTSSTELEGIASQYTELIMGISGYVRFLQKQKFET